MVKKLGKTRASLNNQTSTRLRTAGKDYMDQILTLILLILFWWAVYRWLLPKLGAGG